MELIVGNACHDLSHFSHRLFIEYEWEVTGNAKAYQERRCLKSLVAVRNRKLKRVSLRTAESESVGRGFEPRPAPP